MKTARGVLFRVGAFGPEARWSVFATFLTDTACHINRGGLRSKDLPPICLASCTVVARVQFGFFLIVVHQTLGTHPRESGFIFLFVQLDTLYK